MDAIIIGLVLGIIGFVGFIFYKQMTKSGGTKKEKKEYVATTQDNLVFEVIRKGSKQSVDQSNGIAKLKRGGYRIYVEIPSVNTQLMDNQEIESIFWIYKEILDSIEFPFQLVQQSRTLDISDYYDLLRTKMRGARNKLEEKELELYQDFVKEVIHNYSILTKHCYMVIPYDEEKERKNNINSNQKPTKNKKNQAKETTEDKVKEEERFEKAKRELESRADFIVRSIKRLGIEPRILSDQEVMDLLYVAYNKEKSITQPLMYTNPKEFTTMYVKPNGGGRYE